MTLSYVEIGLRWIEILEFFVLGKTGTECWFVPSLKVWFTGNIWDLSAKYRGNKDDKLGSAVQTVCLEGNVYISFRYKFQLKPFTGDKAVFAVAHYEHVTCPVPNVLNVRNAPSNGLFCPSVTLSLTRPPSPLATLRHTSPVHASRVLE
jgi:hypothetical protein